MLDCENALPSLLCEEDESCLIQQYHYRDEIFDLCSDFEYTEMLLQKEITFESNSNTFLGKTEKRWLNCARLDAIKWILKTRALFGFHFSTAYLSVIYFDQFFARRSIDNGKVWAIRLLSVACLSLAAKMEECRVPALSEYHVDEYIFETSGIQRMELLVLSTLKWKISYATPFAYLNYFINKFCGDCCHKDVKTGAIELVLSLIKEINTMEHRSSVIAAAAVLAAYDYPLSENLLEIKVNAIPSWGSLEKQEHAFSCYNLLQEIGTSRSKKSEVIVSRSIDTLDVSTITTTTAAIDKKRRLTYIIDGQHCPHLKIPRS